MNPYSRYQSDYQDNWRAQVDQEGRLIIPAEAATRLGLQAGAEVELEADTNGLKLHRPFTHLAKVYVEPTNRCNLHCRTCMRNSWNITQGMMSEETFERFLSGLASFWPPPSIFFGGLGEPLDHPDIVEMVARSRALGGQVELITNGTLLGPEMALGLIRAGLDSLWVSLDGATPESFSDLRLGAELPTILENLSSFRRLASKTGAPAPQLGIAFVAMKHNLADLPNVLQLGRRFEATRFSISNVLPYTAEMRDEMLCQRAVYQITTGQPSPWVPHIQLPKMDLEPAVRDVFYRVFRGLVQPVLNGARLGGWSDRCPFIQAGTAAINWEGGLSPCLPLMHDHTSFLEGYQRRSLPTWWVT